MEVLYPICAGLDVHKDSIKACLRTPTDGKRRSTIQTFGTTTRELLRLAAGLVAAQCTHVAMESTITHEVIQKALETVPTRQVRQWCQQHLGPSVQTQRHQAFRPLKQVEQKQAQFLQAA